MGVMGLIMLRRGFRMDGAMWYGKVCTAVTYLVVFVLLLCPQLDRQIQTALIRRADSRHAPRLRPLRQILPHRLEAHEKAGLCPVTEPGCAQLQSLREQIYLPPPEVSGRRFYPEKEGTICLIWTPGSRGGAPPCSANSGRSACASSAYRAAAPGERRAEGRRHRRRAHTRRAAYGGPRALSRSRLGPPRAGQALRLCLGERELRSWPRSELFPVLPGHDAAPWLARRIRGPRQPLWTCARAPAPASARLTTAPCTTASTRGVRTSCARRISPPSSRSGRCASSRRAGAPRTRRDLADDLGERGAGYNFPSP